MNIDDAIYAAVLHWYGQEVCRPRRERLTLLAANNIRLIAASFQVRPERTAGQLGFDFDKEPAWTLDAIRIAKICVSRCGCLGQVQQLCVAIADLTVADLESYSEAYP